MAKKRRSNPLALAVLALLFERPMHPYEIATTLRERRKEDSIKIRFGSLYTVIDLLQADGLIVPHKTFREGRRPERTIYGLSPAGKAEMSDWLRELIVEPVKEYTHFEAGLCLLPALPPGEAIDLLNRREQCLLNDFRQLRAELDAALGQGIPPLFLVEHEYRLSRMDAERQFVLSLLRRIAEEGWAMSPAWNHFQGICPQPEPRGDKKQTRPKIGKRKPVS
jgi:DNA-binding PadR family transcriptional regulator